MMSSFIIVGLTGGLGNQLFQYATACALAKRHDAELYWDTSLFYQTSSKDTLRNFALSHFDIAGKEVSREILKKCYNPKSKKDSLKKLLGRKSIRYINERQFHYDARILLEKPSFYLYGYWQSEQYFKEMRSDLVRELKPSLESFAEYENLVQRVTSCPSVSLHIRRGDYISNAKASKLFEVLDNSYYCDAIDFFEKKVESPYFFIFSDDADWAKKQYETRANCEVVNLDHSLSHLYEHSLMSQCKHNIIANSSFSWWAAWLNESPEKVVIAPKQWFKDPSIETKDLIPESWIRL